MVDMHALRQMGDNDLKDLRIPMLVLEEMKVKKVSLVAGQLWLHSDGRFLAQLIFKRSIVIELISVPKGQRDIFYELRIENDPQKKKLVVHGWWAYLYDSNTDTYYSRCCIGWTEEEEQEAGRVLDELLEGNPDLQIQMDEFWYSQGNKTNKEFRTHEYLKHGRVEETEDFNEGYYNELMTAVKYSGYEKVEANIIGAYSVGGKCWVSKLQNDLSNEIGVRVKLLLDHETHRKFKGFGILYKDDKMTKIDHPDGRLYKNRRFQVEVVH
ncbi:hypothetical protein OROHE_020056 [Orobanche hederae]